MKLESKSRLAAIVLRALGRSWRPQWEGMDGLQAARQRSPGGNVIYAIWHNALAILAWTHRHRDIQVLVSQHDDGEVIARVLQTMGYGLVRGSSRRGGVQALFDLRRQLAADRDVAVTVDGPLGPRYSMHAGVLLLARKSGRPIVPVIATAGSRFILGSWDALRLPRPGSRVRVQYGEPVWIPETADSQQLEARRRQLRDDMCALTKAEEARHGHEVTLRDIQDHRGAWERWSESTRPSVILRGLGTFYAAGVHVDRLLRRRPPGRGRPWVVGIGNLEAGGTGKTPVLLLLAQQLQRRGVRVAVLTRGHGGSLGATRPMRLQGSAVPDGASDETRLMRQALAPEVPLIVSRHKRRGYMDVRADATIDVILVDDAFQSAGIPVDRHLVLLDAQQPLGNGFLLPAGRLREPSHALGRADVLLFTRASGAEMPSHASWRQRPDDCFLARSRVGPLLQWDGSQVQAECLRGGGVATICGIGKPQPFEATVRQLASTHGFELRRCVRVADHGSLHRRLGKLLERLPALQCQHVVMTRKDACRLVDWNDNEPLLVLEQRLEIEAIDTLLQRLLPDPH